MEQLFVPLPQHAGIQVACKAVPSAMGSIGNIQNYNIENHVYQWTNVFYRQYAAAINETENDVIPYKATNTINEKHTSRCHQIHICRKPLFDFLLLAPATIE